jgi:hypothetical protein
VSHIRHAFFLTLATVAAVASTGCATMAHGSWQTVTITSDPSGARVTVLSDPPGGSRVVRSNLGVTPIQIELARRDPHIVIHLEKDGCAPADIRLTRTTSGWVAGNLVFANPLSMQGMTHPASQYPVQLVTMLPLTFGLDMLSGAAFNLPKAVHATLCGPATAR